MLREKVILVVALLALCNSIALAYSSSNIRPVSVSGNSLQSELDQIFGLCPTVSCVNAITDQSPEGMWHASTLTNPTVTAVLQFNNVPSGDVFGIWSDPSNLVPLIYGSANPTDSSGFPTSATLQWNSTGMLRVTSSDCSEIACSTSNIIQPNAFGFYLQAQNGTTFYTVDSLNPHGSAEALAYNYDNEWVLAFNDPSVTGSSASYSDFVVGIQSISGLPEPSSLLLFGSSLPLLGFVRWRLSRARKA
jgi:hypothetical protein